MENLGILLIGALLIVGVLFIGYKMDTTSSFSEKPSRKRKSKHTDYDEGDNEENNEENNEEYDVVDTKTVSDTDYDDDEYYDNDDTEVYEADNTEYEDEDISLFSNVSEETSSFSNDVDDDLSFDVEDEKPAKKTRGRKSKKVEPVEEIEEVKVDEEEDNEDDDDMGSTMIFDTEKLNVELEAIDEMDQNGIDYAKGMGSSMLGEFGKAKEEEKPQIDIFAESEPEVEEIEKVEDVEEPASVSDLSEGLFQATDNDSESFMNEIKRMQEEGEADEFSGFAVEEEPKPKKYTRKSTKVEEEQMTLIPEEPVSTGNVDIEFLVEMEKNLKKNQEEKKASKSKKSTTKSTTTRKSTKKKSE